MNRFKKFDKNEKDVLRMALRRFFDQLFEEEHLNQAELELNTSTLYYELMESIKESEE